MKPNGAKDALQGDGILAVLERELSTLRRREARTGRDGDGERKSGEDGVLHLGRK